MKAVEENEILSSLYKEYNIELPYNLQNRFIYEEIKNFKDAEYIYCIAYEMLIRTDEYTTILEEYESIKNISKQNMINNEFLKLRELINRMNELGLKKTSFVGFDCDDDNDHVFKRIEYYDEVINSPWNVRMLHKFKIEPTLGFDSIFHMLVDFYLKKEGLYINYKVVLYLGIFDSDKNILDMLIDLSKNSEEKFENAKEYIDKDDHFTAIHLDSSIDINKINIVDLNKILCFLHYISKNTYEKDIVSLANIIFLKELDKDFLALLKEEQNNDLVIPIRLNHSLYNTEFWNKYYVNDIKNGLNKLIEFHINNNLIYDQNIQQVNSSINEILENQSNFYIPCVNRLIKSEVFKWRRTDDSILNDDYLKNLEFDGVKAITAHKGYTTLKKEENIYLVQISKYISLGLLKNSFLKTLTYEDLKNIYIDTEPKFSRPRLMFDEARLTNIPTNLNLSKEDLLLYISQIKDEYDRDKNIVKTDIEYFFSDLTEMPSTIKLANEKRSSKDKRLFPKKRLDFKENLALAFYIYDLYKFFVPLFEKKKKKIKEIKELKIKEIKENTKKKGRIINNDAIKDIKEEAENEIKNYENNNLITQISYLFNNLSDEQIGYYLTTMKEFIHGINLEKENNFLKKQSNPEKKENTKPKYKNLIIGNSNIIKTNKSDLIKILID